MNWTSSIWLERIFWMSDAFGLVLLASLGFNRFDTSKIKERKQRTPWFIRKNLHGLIVTEFPREKNTATFLGRGQVQLL
jgi:hypothetical protein